ncbi:MAG TPA: molybdopterin-guanine dinucleotide biosynthesis protein B [Syntrophothermus lipocalidus]|uniref:Molybdopterin-guanine dinucleotide biosynthesis protein B n=1 Tax=Syntrophothermus lipocalidus (strain DSM 12680 / TGB-C1) TaxID=643648 RepID=D7CNR1_SYNLT|nr:MULTISPECIES: molybdopterin-guanine dinucleotide biosynthesis protein B [Syntrophothermus]ADI02346.1 molybdopterin-guanine dinucleotide biosynthesis protein B [Syntrophothermus lipocalidus DSM 12680]NSW84013.1 molybdopterin-guanine dinucleotide biosynthesis protein B [Syntrophothermus sp.]HHV76874.1 molybdopterin-guanine dinucleotide biosynthesis protein B [Syntrophothermus lipocalidus]HOV42300.1 molybdopterin-guanine dinucleotide biosynthesis protein B [Syntrophothermus lipocalidus]
MVPVIAFVGSHNAGKTTLLEKVISSLQDRGFKVGVIKHAFHPIVFEEGSKDSMRLFKAGASLMAVVSNEIAVEYRQQEGKMSLDEILKKVTPGLDIVLVEGFKNEDLPKIQVIRREVSSELMELNQTIAVVSDFDIGELPVPVFQPNDSDKLVDFIINYCLKGNRIRRAKPGNG